MRNLKRGLFHLQTSDPVMAGLISRFGRLHYPKSKKLFDDLVYSIIEQQLSSKAAHTIYSRFLKLFLKQKYTPQQILDLDLSSIRSVGTSWAKARSLHDLSQKVLDKTVQLEKLATMSDDDVIRHLVQVKGIGRWSAEMFLMFNLHSPDAMPLDDRGIQNAMIRLYKLKDDQRLKTKMLKTSDPWRPYRTLACWYLWKSLDT